MRIGLTAVSPTTDKVIEHAQAAERDGFTSLWFASYLLGDPLGAMALAGRETSSIELGTAVLQTYPCHPGLQANRTAAAAAAMGRPGLVLGLGPSHQPVIEGVFGLSYEHPGRSTEEYLRILVPMLQGAAVDVDGEAWSAHSGQAPVERPVPVLLAALGPRLLRVAGQLADGVVLWMAPAR